MEVTVNGEKREIAKETNLSEFLEKLSLSQERIAVELNKQVVRRKDWATIQVKDADKIEIVHFVGGG